MQRLPLALAFVLLLATGLALSSSRSVDERERFLTDRVGAREPALTDDAEEAFTFAVFGDRTGGPAEGIRVLEQAVDEVNLLGPDLVMTVGDLIQGYNTTAEWLPQMREYRDVMAGLDVPWFPVAGNHDVYWRGEGRPPNEHEESYERHFGPLWYAFEHKGSWFVVLYTDEGHPETGLKRFDDPAHQRMSPEQLAWLEATLERTADARHVFVFLHHPRWTGGNYGDDWDRVHARLVAAGNVSAVFAGHIHHMRYDPADGIEYFTLATVGGGQSGDLPEAGWLHQYTYVTVRGDAVETVSYPVGSAQDPRAITGALANEARRATRETLVRTEGDATIDLVAGGAGGLELALRNPLDRPLELVLRAPATGDPRWRFEPATVRRLLDPGTSARVPLRVERLPGAIDAAFDTPRLARSAAVLFEELRVPLPDAVVALPVAPARFDELAGDHALVLDGDGDHAAVPAERVAIPDGPFTVEAWVRADDLAGQQGLVAKTEQSELGLFLSDGKPELYVHLDGAYRIAAAEEPALAPGRWHHVAGVFDGAEARVYVDGHPVAAEPASGARTTNALPLVIGGDVTGSGGAASPFDGAIDEVRLSTGARYTAPFDPPLRPTADAATLLHLTMDAALGPWLRDESAHAAHAELRAGARLAPVR